MKKYKEILTETESFINSSEILIKERKYDGKK